MFRNSLYYSVRHFSDNDAPQSKEKKSPSLKLDQNHSSHVVPSRGSPDSLAVDDTIATTKTVEEDEQFFPWSSPEYEIARRREIEGSMTYVDLFRSILSWEGIKTRIIGNDAGFSEEDRKAFLKEVCNAFEASTRAIFSPFDSEWKSATSSSAGDPPHSQLIDSPPSPSSYGEEAQATEHKQDAPLTTSTYATENSESYVPVITDIFDQKLADFYTSAVIECKKNKRVRYRLLSVFDARVARSELVFNCKRGMDIEGLVRF